MLRKREMTLEGSLQGLVGRMPTPTYVHLWPYICRSGAFSLSLGGHTDGSLTSHWHITAKVPGSLCCEPPTLAPAVLFTGRKGGGPAVMERKLRRFLFGPSERGWTVEEELGPWSCIWLGGGGRGRWG